MFEKVPEKILKTRINILPKYLYFHDLQSVRRVGFLQKYYIIIHLCAVKKYNKTYEVIESHRTYYSEKP